MLGKYFQGIIPDKLLIDLKLYSLLWVIVKYGKF